jgi:hypothetical protein
MVDSHKEHEKKTIIKIGRISKRFAIQTTDGAHGNLLNQVPNFHIDCKVVSMYIKYSVNYEHWYLRQQIMQTPDQFYISVLFAAQFPNHMSGFSRNILSRSHPGRKETDGIPQITNSMQQRPS